MILNNGCLKSEQKKWNCLHCTSPTLQNNDLFIHFLTFLPGSGSGSGSANLCGSGSGQAKNMRIRIRIWIRIRNPDFHISQFEKMIDCLSMFWPNNNMFWVSRREYLQRQWTKSSWPLGLMTRQLCGSSVHGMGRFCALRPLPTPYWLQPTRTDCRSCYLKAVSLHAFINWYPASM